jgi:hypothetical protein
MMISAQTPFKPAASNAIVSPRPVTPVSNGGSTVALKNAPMMVKADHSVTGVIPADGGRSTAITISGQKFGSVASDVQVKINGVSAIITGISDNQITAVVPDKAGTGPISVAVKGKWASGIGFIYDWSAAINFFAGVGNNYPGYADGTGSSVKFNHPTGLARDAVGNIYIADCENNRIRKMNNFGEVTTLAGSGAVGFADGMGTAAMFHHPYSLAVDAAGNVYVADLDNYRVRKITPAGMVTTIAGNARQYAVDGTGAAAGFSSLRGGVCIDGSNNIYVADGAAIRKITPAGSVSTYRAGPGGMIVGMAINNNEIYIATNSGIIGKLSPNSGMVSNIAGTSGAYGDADGYGTGAKLSSVVNMCMDAAGVMYVMEQNGDENPSIRMRRVSKDGYVGTVRNVSTNMGLLAGTVGDAPNSFYLADRTFNCIRKVTLQ